MGKNRGSSDLILMNNTCLLSPPGLGDMAVSNTIGSNVFDILVGLGIPWGLQTMVINYGSTVSSSHLLISEMDARHVPFMGVMLALALFQPRALGDAPPPSLWDHGTHFPRRIPEQPEGCLQGEPLFAQHLSAPPPRTSSCWCAPPGPELRLEAIVSRPSTAMCSPRAPTCALHMVEGVKQSTPGSWHGWAPSSPDSEGTRACFSR